MDISNRVEQLAAKAALWIREAKDNNGSLLIATGAGMSFESGLDDITVEGFKRQFSSMAARGFRTMLVRFI
jgi:NAD-dependent SIR2 family protein deacetylase